MKKLLGIVVLGLLWCNTSFAEILIFDCKRLYTSNSSVTGIVYKIDTFLQEVSFSYYRDGKKAEGQPDIYLNKSGTQITYKFSDHDSVYQLDYGKDSFIDYQISPKHKASIKCIARATAKKSEPKKKKPKKKSPDDSKVVAAASGTGFFVSNNGYIITNHHVIEGCRFVKVNFKGSAVEAKTLAIDKVNDIAILKTNIKPEKIYSVSNEDVSLLEDVIVAGYPLGKKVSSAIKTHKGVVTSLAGAGDNYSNFQTDATINQGNSGGPIIDKNGNVVGIAVATWVEEGVQGIHFGIKSSVLKTFANSKDLNFLQPNRREISKEKLGELISEATTYLECWMTGAKIKKMIAAGNSNKAIYSKFK